MHRELKAWQEEQRGGSGATAVTAAAMQLSRQLAQCNVLPAFWQKLSVGLKENETKSQKENNAAVRATAFLLPRNLAL